MSRVVKQMSPYKDGALRKDLLVAATLVGVGLANPAIALPELKAERPQLAQATPSPEPSPPAESMPGGTRPTTPAPEPARPGVEAQKEGAKPPPPPPPGGKVAPPNKGKWPPAPRGRAWAASRSGA